MKKLEAIFALIGTAISSWLGLLTVPVYILIGLGFADYLTGYAAAPHRGEKRNSTRGWLGIIKKICTLLIVGLAAIVDWLLKFAVGNAGMTLPNVFVFANITAIWLICNEIASILENIGDIGVALPPFLRKAVEWVKKSAEKKGELNVSELKKEDENESANRKQF